MKDLSHHQKHTRKKVIRKARQEQSKEAKVENKEEVEEPQEIVEEGIEIVEQPVVMRPLNRKYH